MSDAAATATEAFIKLREEIATAFEQYADALALLEKDIFTICKEIAAIYKEFSRLLFEQYPNKRVLHLARYGKGRTKKKNINRIIKWLERNASRLFG